MHEEEKKAFIEYSNANIGQIKTRSEIRQGVEDILQRSLSFHDPSHFVIYRALEPKGTGATLFVRIKHGSYLVTGECLVCKRKYYLSQKDFFNEYCRNSSLRQVLLNGDYRYVNGCLVNINASEIQQNGLSYANSDRPDLDKYAIGFFPQNNDSNMLCFEVPYTKADFDKDYAHIRNRNKTLGQMIKEIQEDYNISINDMVVRTGLSLAAVDRLRNDRNEHKELLTMVNLCAGLDLEPKVANELFRLAGLSLNDTTPTNRAYEIIVNYMHGLPAESKNDFLTMLDIPPLKIRDLE